MQVTFLTMCYSLPFLYIECVRFNGKQNVKHYYSIVKLLSCIFECVDTNTYGPPIEVLDLANEKLVEII